MEFTMQFRNKAARAKWIALTLRQTMGTPKIPLHHTDPYTLLIAVLLSAQCTDAMVNRVTPVLFAKAATPSAMTLLSEEKIYQIIKSCGLAKTKARAIRNLSSILIEKYGGSVPPQIKELEKLPGVGHKTASVVAAQAFGLPAFPVDTHIFRCAHRWGLSSAKTVAGVERDLKRLFPRTCWIEIHLQMIYFARKFCPARSHKISHCPICSILTAHPMHQKMKLLANAKFSKNSV